MELYNNKNYEKCITVLLNKEFSVENNLYIGLSLYELKRYDAAIKYFNDINFYFEDETKSKDENFYKQLCIYTSCLYLNKIFDTCIRTSKTLIDNAPNNMRDLKEIAYVILIKSYRDDIESGYQILKEYVKFGLGSNTGSLKSHWRKYAEYSEQIDDFDVYFELYKKYDKDSYEYICLKKNLLDMISAPKNSMQNLLLLCATKQFDKYENVLIKKKDYVNLALYYINYLHEPDKALTFISINADIICKAIKLFIQKKYNEFIKFFENSYERIYDNSENIIIYDCASVDTTTLFNFFFKNENRIKRKLENSIKFHNAVMWKLIKGISKMNINKYSEAIFELEEIEKFDRNVKILLAISTYKNDDFFQSHLKYLKDIPDTGFTKRNLIEYYNIVKNKNKADETIQEYLTQSPANFSCYYGIIPNIELKLFDRNRYGLLPIVSLLYSKNCELELIKLFDFRKIKKNNSYVSLLNFVNTELNTVYDTMEELCTTENMNLDIFLSLDEHIKQYVFSEKN